MPNDRDKLLDRLHAALRDEYTAAFCYEIQAHEARESQHKRLADRLEAIASDHRRHINLIDTRIKELGGEPQAFEPPPELLQRMRCLPQDDLCIALEHDLKTEDTEIETYQTIAGQSDSNTAAICRKLSHEDHGHVEWLRKEIVQGQDYDD